MKNFFKRVVLIAICGVLLTGCSAQQDLPVDEPNIPSVIAENIGDSSVTSNVVTEPVVSAETTAADPWLSVREKLASSDTPTQEEPSNTELYYICKHEEASKACVMLLYDYYTTNNEYIGKGVYSVYPNSDDFEINFRVFVKNRARFPSILALHPMLPQDTDMYKLEYDVENELPYEFGLCIYRWHLTSFPSLDSIRNWGNTWINGGYCEPFFTLSSTATAYFKYIGTDSQVIPATRYATYASKFSAEDPYFVDSITGIKYWFGINEVEFSETGNTVAIPYLKICSLTDFRDVFCDLYYKYGTDDKTFVPDDWVQDYKDLTVSGEIDDELEPGESAFGYIVMPYRGNDIYRFYGARGNSVRFRLYPQSSEISNMMVCVQESCIVNTSAVVDYDTLYDMADYYCDTSSTLLSQNILYTESDKAAFTNYYNYVASNTSENIWVQFACDPYLMWCVKDDVLHIYHIADPNGDPAYMLSGDVAWAVAHSAYLAESDLIQRKNGISGYLEYYNSLFGSSITLRKVH